MILSLHQKPRLAGSIPLGRHREQGTVGIPPAPCPAVTRIFSPPEGSKVRHLRFEDVGPNSLKASWDSADGAVLGYRVRCRRQSGPSSVLSVSPQVHSVLLTDLPSGTTGKVCVQPVYRNQPGKRLCRTVHRQPGELGARHVLKQGS